MSLFLFLGSVMSQKEGCMTLDANSPCGPEFNGAPVLFNSMAQFLENIDIFANSSKTIEQINNSTSCIITNEDALKQQYQTTFVCAWMVSDAIKNGSCPSMPPFEQEKVNLCSDVCHAARDSVYKSMSICNDTQISIINPGAFCSSTKGKKGQDICFAGTASEAEFCGMIFDFLITRFPNQRGSRDWMPDFARG
jgi:hypothetical protein